MINLRSKVIKSIVFPYLTDNESIIFQNSDNRLEQFELEYYLIYLGMQRNIRQFKFDYGLNFGDTLKFYLNTIKTNMKDKSLNNANVSPEHIVSRFREKYNKSIISYPCIRVNRLSQDDYNQLLDYLYVEFGFSKLNLSRSKTEVMNLIFTYPSLVSSILVNLELNIHSLNELYNNDLFTNLLIKFFRI